MVAAEKLDDKALAQQVYADVAMNAKNWGVRKTAVDKLDDKVLAQQAHAVVAKKVKREDIRILATKKLDDIEFECNLEREKERERERERVLKEKVTVSHLLFSVSFEGRAQRKEYWLFQLYAVLFDFFVIIFFNIIDKNPDPMMKTILYFNCLYIFLVSLGISVRRLHDIGKSGWMLFIGLIPLVGTIWLFVLYLRDSQPGTNKYGPNPKGVENI